MEKVYGERWWNTKIEWSKKCLKIRQEPFMNQMVGLYVSDLSN